MTVYKAFTSIGNSETEKSVSLDIQNDGFIEAVTLGVSITGGTADAAGDFVSAEVSFSSTAGISTHDTRGSLCTAVAVVGNPQTDGGFSLMSTPFCVVPGISVPVRAGERIFLHLSSDENAVTGQAAAYIFVRDSQSVMTRRRLRQN